jgi:hypothetical protein
MSEDEEHLQELCLTWQRQLQQAIWAQQPAAAPQVQYSACPETGGRAFVEARSYPQS